MARKKQETKEKPSKAAKASQKNSAPLKRHRPEEPEEVSTGLLDDTTKRDIAGISFIILAIVFMLVVAMPSDGALVTSFASEWIKLIFGVGAYMLPLILAAIGATFLYRSQKQRVPARAAIGLTVLFIALLGLIATFTPITSLGVDDLQLLFFSSNLTSHGGYVGAGLAFCLMSLFGRIIAAVIFIGVMIIGLVIVGFSISRTIEKVRTKKRQFQEKLTSDASASLTSRKLRVRKAEEMPFQQVQPDLYGGYEGYGSPALCESASSMGSANMTQPLLGANEAPAPSGSRALDRRIEAAKSILGDPHEAAHASDAAVTQPLGASLTAAPAAASPVRAEAACPPVQDAVSVPLPKDPHEVFVPLPNLEGYAEEAPEEDEVEDPSPDDFTQLRSWKARGERTGSLEDGGATTRSIEALAAALPRIDDGALPVPSHVAVPDPSDQSCLANGADTQTVRLPHEDASKKTKAASAKKEAPSAVASAGSGIIRGDFELPSMTLLRQPETSRAHGASGQDLALTAQTLQQTLEDFGINATVVGWIEGPTVTLFQVDLPSGVRVSRITNLNDDIALALASPGVRIFAPIPGTNHVGIEIPNKTRQTVYLSEVLASAGPDPLEIAIGKDVEGRSIVSDLAKMPHLLIGGTTGSGKSVSINAMIMSILMRATPDEVRFIMIDPKRVEFTPYNGIPHLYVPVVTEPKEAASALSWGVAEMERRLKVFSKIGVRNITQYNAKVSGGGVEDGEGRELDPLPYIVIIIDELADLMMNVGKEVEFSISRIAQLARAAGIHLIVATQRPSTNVVTGLIKANITNRIAFNVASGIDSRVILDTPGAESLIGLGDMLLSKPELPKPQRIQACYVSEEEIGAVVDFIKAQGEPDYHQDILATNVMSLGDTSPQGGSGGAEDPLIWEAAELVVSSKMGSTSNIQRRLKVGYARAGRIMDQLEELGVVGPANGSKPREVYLDELELETLKAFESTD